MEQFLDNKPKILSPAGDPDALKFAVYNGADAVYFGLNKFNARMKANNFSTENLQQWVDFCHLFGVKVYVTINTSIKNEEFQEACELGAFCYRKNVDGLILTDVGLISFFAKNFPNFDLTLSTQQNVHNIAGAKIAKELGCNRVVLSRETPLVDVEKIKEKVDINLETFLHGALCVAISGQCLFSSFIDGQSGNRGLCAQPCRQKYISYLDGKETKSGYLLSARDLCLARNIPKLAYAGVETLKIEGRNRRPQYVAQTTQVYRKILDNNFDFSEEDLQNLKKIYNRGNYTNGYLNNNYNIIYPNAQGHIGIKVGELTKQNGEFIVKSNLYLHDGDAFKILRNGEEVGNALCTCSTKNGFAKLSVNGECKVGDDVNITTSVAQIAKLDATNKTLPIKAIFKAKIGDYAELKLIYKDVEVTVKSEQILQKAQKQPISTENIKQQLQKTGNTSFTILEIVNDVDEIFMPISSINALRRDGLNELSKKIIDIYNIKLNRNNFDAVSLDVGPESSNYQSHCKENICIYLDESNDTTKYGDDTIVAFKPNDYNLNNAKDFVGKINVNHIFLDLPNFATEADYSILKSILKTELFEGVVANNLYGIYLAKELNLKIILGLGMNIFNQQALSTLAKLCGKNYYSFAYSQELTLNEVSAFIDKSGFIFADGEICLMTLAHCPMHVNTKYDCGKCLYQGNELVYTDKTNRRFLLKRKRIAKCYWELFNCLPLCGANKLINTQAKYLLKPDLKRRKEVYNYYHNKDKLQEKTKNHLEPNHTTGHLSRKIK